MKMTQNAPPLEVDPLVNRNNKTILERYIFAAHWCKGKSVLDASCGYGFGSAILKALGASSVTGSDIDKDALKYCKEKHTGCKFYNMDLTNRVSNGHPVYDVIVSIETMEHLPKEDMLRYLRNMKMLLKRNGKLIITTPIRRSMKFVYKGGTHLYEYNEPEFKSVIRSVFTDFEVNSIVEFKLRKEAGMLHSEFEYGISEDSRLFFAICTKK